MIICAASIRNHRFEPRLRFDRITVRVVSRSAKDVHLVLIIFMPHVAMIARNIEPAFLVQNESNAKAELAKNFTEIVVSFDDYFLVASLDVYVPNIYALAKHQKHLYL